MGIDETSMIPLKLRRSNASFTLREIFYNHRLRVRSGGETIGDGSSEKALLQLKSCLVRPKLVRRVPNINNCGGILSHRLVVGRFELA